MRQKGPGPPPPQVLAQTATCSSTHGLAHTCVLLCLCPWAGWQAPPVGFPEAAALGHRIAHILEHPFKSLLRSLAETTLHDRLSPRGPCWATAHAAAGAWLHSHTTDTVTGLPMELSPLRGRAPSGETSLSPAGSREGQSAPSPRFLALEPAVPDLDW